MNREELLNLSLEELRRLGRERRLGDVDELSKSQLVDALSPAAGPAPRGARLRQRALTLLQRIDLRLGQSLKEALSRMVHRGDKAEGPAADGAAVVYPGPEDSGSSGLSGSAGAQPLDAARAPRESGGAVDRATLTVEGVHAYQEEGRYEEAIAILQLLLEDRPDDPELLQLLDELHGLQAGGADERKHRGRPRPSPSGTGPASEPLGMLDLAELPETYGVDEVEVLYKDPWWIFVYWEATDAGIEAARTQLGSSAQGSRLMLRLFTMADPSADPGKGSGRQTKDIPLTWNHGRRYLEVPRPGTLVRVAVGLLSPEGFFASIAHSQLLRLPPPMPSTQVSQEWLHVAPPRSRGLARERIVSQERAADHHERSLAWRVQGEPPAGARPPGSSAQGERGALYQDIHTDEGRGSGRSQP